MAVDVKTAFENLVRQILGDPAAARAYATDQQGTLAEIGVTGGELSAVEMRSIVEDVCAEMDLSPQVSQALQSYYSGGPSGGVSPAGASSGPSMPPATAPAAQPPLQTVQQHLNYVTYATYEGDETITNDLTNIDNSTNLRVDGDNLGDIDVTNVNATGDGAVAAGRDVDNAATGDGAVVVDGNNEGNIQTGDGIQVDGNVDDSALIAGDVSNSNVVGDMDDSSIVSGDVGGNVTSVGDLDIDDAAVNFGDGSTATNISDVDTQGGDANIGLNQGGGINQVNTDDTAAAQGGGDAFGDVDDSAVGAGASNVSDLDDGSAVGQGSGDVSGSDIDNSFNDNVDSNFEQGPGSQAVDQVETVETPPEPIEDPMEGMD